MFKLPNQELTYRSYIIFKCVPMHRIYAWEFEKVAIVCFTLLGTPFFIDLRSLKRKMYLFLKGLSYQT
jgi:hypothetical protein